MNRLSCLIKPIQQFWRKKMKKIYRFDCLNNTIAVTVEEFQTDAEKVILKVHNEKDILILEFDRDEFYELCNMRYRMDFPVEITAQLPELTLVA